MGLGVGRRGAGDLVPSSECLFYSDNDCYSFCGGKPLEDEPDTVWNYNSGKGHAGASLRRHTRSRG